MLSAAQILMPEICGQLRQQMLYVGTVPIPCDDPVNGGGVTKVVQTGRIARSFIAPEAYRAAYTLE